MPHRMRMILAGCAAVLAAGGTLASAGWAVAVGRQSARPAVTRACPPPQRPGFAACMALVRTDVAERKGVSPLVTPAGYGPADLRDAYKLPASGGAGQTVAIVDAYDDPNAAADLAVYRAQYGLSPCADGCFEKVNQQGEQGNYPDANPGWGQEISLDLDMVSAICPDCHILLVEADDESFDNLGASVDEAVALGAKYVSNSYGSNGEASAETGFDSHYDHPGVAITASAGDAGYAVNYPAAASSVIAVGGTTLNRDATASRGWTESAWGMASGGQGTGSGCSQFEAKPSWQIDAGCANRTVADVSAVANPATGVAIYDSYQTGGWDVVGGTSASSPIIASVYALAGPLPQDAQPARYPYDAATAGAGGLNDVTSGADGSCEPGYLCTGGPGYDGPTGLGTPDGLTAFIGRPSGDLAGTVTDAATGDPVAGASVTVAGHAATTDAAGHYDLTLPAASYQATAADYGYDSSTSSVTVPAGGTATADFALTGAPHQPVHGTVTAGAGHPWPLYAKVTWSDSSGHSGTVYTTPKTGDYALSLLGGASYQLSVSAIYPGYQPFTASVAVAGAAVTKNVALGVDLTACTAIGYHATYNGTTQRFSATAVPSRWRVRNVDDRYAGYKNSPGWVFDDPGQRGNTTGGSGHFAIVDSEHYGSGHYQDTQLTSPVLSFAADKSPALQFATDLRPAVNSLAAVEASGDGGRTWTQVWSSRGFPGVSGPADVVVPLPKLAGSSKVLLRFAYRGQWSRYWAIDDVFAGDRVCAQQPGALVTGRVSDAASGAPLDGAVVAGGSGVRAVTVPTPDDDVIGGGFYWLFSPATGSQQFTATQPGYTAGSVTVSLTAGDVVTADFPLAAAGT